MFSLDSMRECHLTLPQALVNVLPTCPVQDPNCFQRDEQASISWGSQMQQKNQLYSIGNCYVIMDQLRYAKTFVLKVAFGMQRVLKSQTLSRSR